MFVVTKARTNERSPVPEYADTAGDGEFAQSRARFDQIVRWLSGPEAARLTHAELEKGLTEQGRELQRTLYQDRLDLQAAREERRQDVTGPEGEPRPRAER